MTTATPADPLGSDSPTGHNASPHAGRTEWCLALIGNPNTGKSTLFSALAGIHQKTGNYPGVTVEKKLGHYHHAGVRWNLIDLPGTYSLAPRSPDEMVTVDVLLGRRNDVNAPDAVLCIVDAGNLNRNLFLVSQVLELGLPTVLALNMTDLAHNKGYLIDAAQLQTKLGVPVVALQAHRKHGVDELREALAKAVEQPLRIVASPPFPDVFRDEVDRLTEVLSQNHADMPRYLVERLILDTGGYLESSLSTDEAVIAEVRKSRDHLQAEGCPIPAVEAIARYEWVGHLLDGVVTRDRTREAELAEQRRWSDRLDDWLTHRFLGAAVFAMLMFLIFMAIFRWAALPMDLIDHAFAALQDGLKSLMPEGALRSLLVDGILGGVGGVVVFLPQIMILFAFIAILEDCGYLARAAYLMDRLMVKVGLSGKSFIPLLSAHACAIPGVMATRVIEDRRDRLATILVTPLMSCSARLPVYLLMITAFVPEKTWLGGWLSIRPLTMFSMYLLGIVTAALAALIFKRTILKGPTPPFVMELPSYKWPGPGLVIRRVFEEGWRFLYRAGTLILAISVVVWALLYFPHDQAAVEAPFADRLQTLATLSETAATDEARAEATAALEALEGEIAGEFQRQSYLGRLGRMLEPAFRPLGWDWRIGCAAIASFPAREVVVSVLGVMFNAGDVDPGEEEDMQRLGTALQSARWPNTTAPIFTLPVALSLMVFFALCSQCAATLAVIKRETNSWFWPAFTFTYMTALAYAAAWITVNVGTWLMG